MTYFIIILMMAWTTQVITDPAHDLTRMFEAIKQEEEQWDQRAAIGSSNKIPPNYHATNNDKTHSRSKREATRDNSDHDDNKKPPEIHLNDTKDDDEVRLVKFLLDNYNKEVRPVRNKNHAVQVTFGMAYTQLLDLDEKNQILVSNVWIRMLWFNHLLTWNVSEFGGIESINLSPLKIWLPDIVLYNNAEETLGSGQMDQFKTKVILRHDGLHKWYAPTILKSRCAINVEYFPFDDQKCQLRFLSWTYDGFRVNITNRAKSADLKPYLPSGEFELMSAESVRAVTIYSCCKEPYPHVTFTIHIRRKTLFYFNNLIVPCFLITALGLLTFILPPATGERVTLVITTLLAMTVFMLMIAEKTPTTSKVTPLIGKFFIASMVIIGLSLIATCIVLNLYECSRSADSVPKLIRVIVLDYLAPFLRVDPPRERTISGLTSSANAYDEEILETDMNQMNTVIRKTNQNGKFLTQIQQNGAAKHNQNNSVNHNPNSVNHNPNAKAWNFHHSNNLANDHRQIPPRDMNYDFSSSGLRQRNTATLPREISEGISILSERARQQDKYEALAEEWQAVAKVADRLFLIIFLITIAATTLYIFVNRPDAPPV